MKPYTIILLALFSAMSGMANNRSVIDNEQLLRQYLEQSQFSIDTGAQAVVLYEKGSSYIPTSANTITIPEWNFQGNYPKLCTEYEGLCPASSFIMCWSG
ncbi:hypothetical protein [Taibaiella helva]|uniref:hypothetical protein n=1 Tax=Taibaiella helva TaxID=2301235 RepID=UPI000E598C9F|nr:hypothetical protein [Taibaiella helva]